MQGRGATLILWKEYGLALTCHDLIDFKWLPGLEGFKLQTALILLKDARVVKDRLATQVDISTDLELLLALKRIGLHTRGLAEKGLRGDVEHRRFLLFLCLETKADESRRIIVSKDQISNLALRTKLALGLMRLSVTDLGTIIESDQEVTLHRFIAKM